MNAPITAARHCRDNGISIQPEERHRGRQHARALVIAFVEQFAGGAGDDGMYAGLSEVRRRHHGAQRRLDRAARVGEKICDAGERLVRLGVKHMQDRADEERVARLLPVVPPFQRALGIDQDVSDVLNISDFPFALANFQERIVGGARRVGRVEQQHATKPRAPAGGQGPVLSLDVVNDGAFRPGEQRRNNEADAFARPGGGEAKHMLGSVVAKIFVTPPAEHHAVVAKEARLPHLRRFRPVGGAIGGDFLHFARTPHGHSDRDDNGCDPARGRDVGAFDEDRSRIGVVGEPPPKEGWRVVDRPAEDVEPGVSQLGLECQAPGDPLRRRPEEGEHNGANGEDLAPEDLGRIHGDGGSGGVAAAISSPN